MARWWASLSQAIPGMSLPSILSQVAAPGSAVTVTFRVLYFLATDPITSQ